MERLTSRENALIKEYRKLSGSRRLREETGCFVLEGARLVLDAAQSGIRLRTLFISDDGGRYPEAAVTTAVIPIASAVRRMVPRLPGSCISSSSR
mgnify:CR=1 FL=1